MDVHLRDLRALIAVAEEESITRAAERLFIAQPALSKQLRSLERQLGFPVLDRHPRGVVLTAAGQTLVAAARDIVARWDEALADFRTAATAGRIVIGMQTAVGRGLQKSALARFRELSPGVIPSLRLVSWSDPSAGLDDGTSDVAFLWLPTPSDDLDVLPIVRERRCVALPSDHRLARQERVAFADLLEEPIIALPPEAGSLRDFWIAAPERNGRPAVIGATAETPDAVFEAVASGLGVVLLSEGNAHLYSRSEVSIRPVDGLSPAVLALAWRRADRRSLVAAFVRAVDEQLG
jgi:DNA-binding transcriptional LysR family regulator